MNFVARAILVHFCSLLLVAPVGWCCWLPPLRAAEKPREPECCCCAKTEKPAPTKTQPEAPEPPTCCCDPQPAAILSAADESSKPPIDALPGELAVESVVHEAQSIGATTVPPFLHDPSPPLRVLHCVWLC